MEEAAVLMLATEGLCFQKVQERQSAPDQELLHCHCSGDPGPVDTSLLAFHQCGVSDRTGSHAGWSPFPIENLSNSGLHL